MPERKFVVMEKIDCPACGGTGRIRYIDRLTGARKRTGCEKCDRSGKIMVEIDFREALRCTMNGGEDTAQALCSTAWNIAEHPSTDEPPEALQSSPIEHPMEENLNNMNGALISLGTNARNTVRYLCAELLLLLLLTTQ